MNTCPLIRFVIFIFNRYQSNAIFIFFLTINLVRVLSFLFALFILIISYIIFAYCKYAS